MVHIPFAYVGPGAGFAFLGSFFSILLSLLAGIASLLLWPFRAVLRLVRGSSARARVVVLGVEGLDAAPADLPNLAYRRLRAVSPDGWAPAGFWKILAEHAVDSTILLLPGKFPVEGIRGRRLWRTAEDTLVSQPTYYARYLVRLLGTLVNDQESLFFSALDHQKRGVLACAFDTRSAAALDRVIARLLQRVDRHTTVFILLGQNALLSNRSLDPAVQTMGDVAPAILRIFGFA